IAPSVRATLSPLPPARARVTAGRLTPAQSTPGTSWVTSRAGLRVTTRITVMVNLPSPPLGQQDERPEAALQSARVCSNIRTSERERKQKRRRGLPDRGGVPDPFGPRSRTQVS